MTPEALKLSIFKNAFRGSLVPQISSEKIIDKTAFIPDECPFDVPDTWKWNTLERCADLCTGNSISESIKKSKYEGRESGLDYIGTKDVEFNHKIIYNNGIKIPENEDFKHAPANSILLCIEGGSAGRKIGITDRTVCFGNKLCNFVCKSINTKYLYYFLQSSEFKNVFADNLSGIIGGVSIKKIKSILIPIPPIEEQERIAAKIENIIPLLDKYKEAWEKLGTFNKQFPLDMEKSVLQFAMKGKLVEQRKEEGTGEEYFNLLQKQKEDLIKQKKIKKDKKIADIKAEEIPFEIPTSWKWCRLRQICSKVVDGDHNPPASTKEKTEYLMLSAININHDSIESLDRVRYLGKQTFLVENERTKITVGDILFTIVGTLGRSTIYTGYPKNICLQRSVSVITTFIYNKYLKIVLDSPYIQSFMVKNSTGTAQKGFYLNQVDELLIPLPPLEEQKRIVDKIEEILPLCKSLQK